MSANENHHTTPRRIIQSFEAKALRRRHWGFKLADTLTSLLGSIVFLSANIIFVVVWFSFKIGDHVLLASILTIESIFLMIIVLMSQIRQNQTTTLRSELQLQVSLITEKELTKVLKLMRLILRKQGVGIENDMELEEMIGEIDASYIERKLEEEIAPKTANVIEKLSEKLPIKKNSA